MAACRPPLLPNATAKVIREVGQVVVVLRDGFGVASRGVSDDSSAATTELGGLDGGVAATVLLGRRPAEHPHRVFDFGAERHRQ